MEGFDRLVIDIPSGTKIPEGTSSLGRLGYVIFTCEDYDTVLQSLAIADKAIRFLP